MIANQILGIAAGIGFVLTLALMFILRFRYRMGMEIYLIALVAGGTIYAVGWLIASALR